LFFKSTRFTATAGILTTEDQLPTTAGFPELSTVTATGEEVVVRLLVFRARAVSVCEPLVAPLVSQVIV
jgi:hypothetical protein